MTGSPNLTIVPDPSTFRVLPWAPGVGWMLCDEYFNNGVPFHFSPRHILRRQLAAACASGAWGSSSGSRSSGICCASCRSSSATRTSARPACAALPVQDLSARARLFLSLRIQHGPDAAGAVGAGGGLRRSSHLPLRSVENEWGPGQVECTFAAGDALAAADNLLLFRTATRQVCRRHGHFATFMCRPGLKGYYSSGWHLHQSVVDTKSGRNLFMPERAGEVLSPLGRMFVAGLLKHAAPAPRSRRRPSTAIGASGPIHWRPIAPPGATTIAA